MAAQEFQCQVEEFRMITPTVFELFFSTDQPFSFKAGQFISTIIPGAGPGGRDLRRAYSIASPPESQFVELCVKIVEGGPGTTYLKNLKVGDKFRGLAPYGDFVYKTSPERRVVFISTGTGIAPFRAMLLSQQYSENPAIESESWFGVRSEEEILYNDLFANLPRHRWMIALSRPQKPINGNHPFQGRVTDYLRTLPENYPWAQTDFYLCGNGDMIKESKALLAERGVAKEAMFQEKYY